MSRDLYGECRSAVLFFAPQKEVSQEIPKGSLGSDAE